MLFSMLFLILEFKDPDLAKNLTNLVDTPQIVGLCRVHGSKGLAPDSSQKN